VSYFSIATDGNAAYRSLRSLRALRALRPLRIISRNPSLRLVVNALFRTVKPIVNVMLVCSLMFLIFGIIMTSLFKVRGLGEAMRLVGVVFCALAFSPPPLSHAHLTAQGGTYTCSGRVFDLMTDEQVSLLTSPVPYRQLLLEQRRWGAGCAVAGNATAVSSNCTSYGGGLGVGATPTSRQVCAWFGGEWVRTMPQSFDNVAEAMGVLFQMATTEQWIDIMYKAIDVRGVEMQPVTNTQPAIGLLFCLFMLFGAYFTVNLFVAAIVDEFERSREQLGESYLLTDTQKEWVKAQEVVLLVKPKRRPRPPLDPWRRSVFNLVTSEPFDQFVLLLIVVNSVALAVPFFGMPQTFGDGLGYLNDAFAVLFTVEASLKIYAFGFRSYWALSAWNKFDFVVVVASDIGVIVSYASTLSIGAIGTLARMMRIARVVRLANSLKSLRQMISTLLITLPSLLNIGSLLALMLFIYAIAGVQLFANVKYGDYVDRHTNFRDVGSAMLMLWRCLTGEAWNMVMYELANTSDCESDPAWNDPFPRGCGSSFAFVYLYSFILINVFVIVQLLIAVVLEAFSDIADEDSQRLNKDELERFAATWVQFDPECTLFISTAKLQSFLSVLPPPMGFGVTYQASAEEMVAFVASLRLPTYAGNFVHFSDVALACARRVIADAVRDRGGNFEEIPNTHGIVKRWEKLRGAAVTLQTDWSIQHFVAADTIVSTFRVFRFRRSLAL